MRKAKPYGVAMFMPKLYLRGIHGADFSQSLSVIGWTFLGVAGISVAVFKEWFLPRRFFFDSNYIINLISTVHTVKLFDSFTNTAMIYKYSIGAGVLSTALLQSGLVCFALYSSVRKYRYLSLHTFAVIATSFLICMIFLTMHDKDIIVLLLVTLMFWLASSRAGSIMWFALALGYGILFREYWILIVAMLAGMTIAGKFYSARLVMLLSPFACIFVLAVLVNLVLHIQLDHYRLLVNSVRLSTGNPDVRTAITTFVSGGSLMYQSINCLVVLGSLLLPVPLAFAGGFLHLMFAFTIAWIWASFILCLSRAGMFRGANGLMCRNFSFLVICFVVLESVFEPDYGSYLRHLSALFPIFWCVLLRADTLRHGGGRMGVGHKWCCEGIAERPSHGLA